MTPETEAKVLSLLERVAVALEKAPPAANVTSNVTTSSAPVGTVLPNYGKAKGQPIAGASRSDLEYYAEGCRKTLADASKERFHARERQMLAAIEAEIARQSGGAVGASDNVPF